MNWTNNTLIDTEKDKLLDFSVNNKTHYSFPLIDSDSDSYYINYKDGKHLKTILTEYCSEDMKTLKNLIGDLWEGDEVCSQASSIILSTYMKLAKNSISLVKEMDIFNYMM